MNGQENERERSGKKAETEIEGESENLTQMYTFSLFRTLNKFGHEGDRPHASFWAVDALALSRKNSEQSIVVTENEQRTATTQQILRRKYESERRGKRGKETARTSTYCAFLWTLIPATCRASELQECCEYSIFQNRIYS